MIEAQTQMLLDILEVSQRNRRAHDTQRSRDRLGQIKRQILFYCRNRRPGELLGTTAARL